jgi:hypothetical protein
MRCGRRGESCMHLRSPPSLQWRSEWSVRALGARATSLVGGKSNITHFSCFPDVAPRNSNIVIQLPTAGLLVRTCHASVGEYHRNAAMAVPLSVQTSECASKAML